jgi:hypothetical protein
VPARPGSLARGALRPGEQAPVRGGSGRRASRASSALARPPRGRGRGRRRQREALGGVPRGDRCWHTFRRRSGGRRATAVRLAPLRHHHVADARHALLNRRDVPRRR